TDPLVSSTGDHGDVDLAADSRPAADPVREASDATTASETPAAIDDAAPTPADPTEEPVTTAWGGVLYLVHGVTALDLPSALDTGPLAALDAPTVLAHVLAGVAGAPVDDPAVRAASGCPVGLDAEPLPALAGPAAMEVEQLADRLRA